MKEQLIKLKNISKAVLTPIGFSYKSGHLLSSILGKAVDSSGNPIPMYTYPALDFIQSKLDYLSDCKILEVGTGNSTLFWMQHVSEIVGIEKNEVWGNYIEDKKSSYNTQCQVSLKICKSQTSFIQTINELKEQEFNLFIIDGVPYPKGSRYEAIQIILSSFNNINNIIVDNSDLSSVTPVLELLQKHGFSKIDFYGYSPGAYHKQCTSYLFNSLESNLCFPLNKGSVLSCSPKSLSN